MWDGIEFRVVEFVVRSDVDKGTFVLRTVAVFRGGKYWVFVSVKFFIQMN